MKLAFALALICSSLLVGGCADTSLMTDEEYRATKGPAAHAPDFSGVLPQSSGKLSPGY